MNAIEAVHPCIRGCTRKGTDERLAARHGHYCDRCYYPADKALRMAGRLTAHTLTQVTGITSKMDDGSQRTKKHPPLPFNVEAFNDANEIYAMLVYWSALWATRLNRPIPAPAARSWRTDNNRIVGLPNDITPEAARYAVGTMGTWLSIHLEDIMSQPKITADDINYFLEQIATLYTTVAKWPMEDAPQYAHVQCPDDNCQGKIILYPPQYFGDDQKIMCEACGRIFVQDDYDKMASVFRQVRDEQARELIKAHRTATRLARKYG